MTVKTIIEQVKKEIALYEGKIQSLKKALALLEDSDAINPEVAPQIRAPRGQRIKQVVDFLSKGPALKSEIANSLLIPIGTLDSVLNRKDLFSFGADGKWSLKK